MNKLTKWLLLSSSWIVYIGYLIYNFIFDDIGLFGAIGAFFMCLLSPFFIKPIGIVELIIIILISVVYCQKWQYKWLFISLLQWIYLALMWVSVNALASV